VARNRGSESATVEALFQERPFLRNLFKGKLVKRALVQVPDHDLLLKMPVEVRLENGYCYGSNMVLLDRDGDEICWVGKAERKNRLTRWVFSRYYFFEEHLQDTLVRLGDRAKEVVFVVELEENGTLIFHRPKKGQTLLKSLAEKVYFARQLLKEKEDALDADK